MKLIQSLVLGKMRSALFMGMGCLWLAACSGPSRGDNSTDASVKDSESDAILYHTTDENVSKRNEDSSIDRSVDAGVDLSQGKTGVLSSVDSGGVLPQGDTDFFSAEDPSWVWMGVPMDDMSINELGRSGQEGDIYRSLGDNRILNLNAYRGLQIIDFSDVSHPVIVGRLPMSGVPKALYVVDNKAVVLMNSWYGYYGARDDTAVYSRRGGVVIIADISDMTAPKFLDHAYVEGIVSASQLTRGGDKAALFLATNVEESQTGEAGVSHTWHPLIKSFDVSGPSVVFRNIIELPVGYIPEIQVAAGAFIVALHSEFSSEFTSGPVSILTLIDISNPDGSMIQGNEVALKGLVHNQFNLDLYNGIVRVASISETDTTYLETFNAADFANVRPVDYCQFSDGLNLYATRFLGNRAFLMTHFDAAQYYRASIDTFYAFSVDDTGRCAQRSKSTVSGWDRFFQPVYDGQRLIGIGSLIDGERTTTKVSLYDIGSLDNPNPLLSTVEVTTANSNSKANGDSQAFTVLEDAVSVADPGGVTETGMVLLPFNGWNTSDNNTQYTKGVQIYTFSQNTLTRRGVMEHGTSVDRTFVASDKTAANLSASALSLFDVTQLDSPEELSRLELSPNYVDLFVFGGFYIRIKDNAYSYSSVGERMKPPCVVAQVIPITENPDWSTPLAEVEFDPSAQIVRAGDMLIGVSSKLTDTQSEPIQYQTTIQVYDLSDPISPKLFGTVTTDKLHPGFGYIDRYGCGPACERNFRVYAGGYDKYNVPAVNQAAIFVQIKKEQTTNSPGAYSLYVLNLSGDTPKLEDPIEMPKEDKGGSVVSEGNSLFYSFSRPFSVAGDPQSYVRYYFKQIDFSNQKSPVMGTAINVPGQVFHVSGDIIYTRDLQFNAGVVETVLNKLTVHAGAAYRQASQRLPNHGVENVYFDPSGNILISYWESANNSAATRYMLGILDRDSLRILNEIEVNRSAKLKGAEGGKALFQVPGGTLIINVSNPVSPFPEAYLDTTIWPRDILSDGSRLTFGAGRYGIYSLNTDFFNLLPTATFSK